MITDYNDRMLRPAGQAAPKVVAVVRPAPKSEAEGEETADAPRKPLAPRYQTRSGET